MRYGITFLVGAVTGAVIAFVIVTRMRRVPGERKAHPLLVVTDQEELAEMASKRWG